MSVSLDLTDLHPALTHIEVLERTLAKAMVVCQAIKANGEKNTVIALLYRLTAAQRSGEISTYGMEELLGMGAEFMEAMRPIVNDRIERDQLEAAISAFCEGSERCRKHNARMFS